MQNENINFTTRNVYQVSAGEQAVRISYDELMPGEYEKRVILGNGCSSLVSMRCIFEGDSADIFYITSGLCTFEEYFRRTAGSLQSFLDAFLKLLNAIVDCEDHLILKDEIRLRMENIFFSEANGNVKLLYMPGSAREGTLGAEMAAVIEDAQSLCSAGMLYGGQLEEYKASVKGAGNNIERMILLTEEYLRRTFSSAAAPYNAGGNEENIKENAVAEEAADFYGTGSSIKKHIKDFINELVS